MDPQVTEQETTTPPEQPPNGAPPPTEQPPKPETKVEATTDATTKKDGEGKVLQVPHSDFKKIKEEARERGRREALAELDAVAVEAGFESHADALKKLGELKKHASKTEAQPSPPETQQMTKPADKKDAKAADKQARESQRLADERSKLRKDWRAAQRSKRDLQRQLDHKDAQMELQKEAYQAGLTDVDYGIRLLTRELAGKSVEEVAKFDRKKFFDDLRAQKPYLFGEKVVPATTGTNGSKGDGSQPATPDASKPVVDAAKGAQFDARTATKEQYEEHLRKLGLNPHVTG